MPAILPHRPVSPVVTTGRRSPTTRVVGISNRTLDRRGVQPGSQQHVPTPRYRRSSRHHAPRGGPRRHARRRLRHAAGGWFALPVAAVHLPSAARRGVLLRARRPAGGRLARRLLRGLLRPAPAGRRRHHAPGDRGPRRVQPGGPRLRARAARPAPAPRHAGRLVAHRPPDRPLQLRHLRRLPAQRGHQGRPLRRRAHPDHARPRPLQALQRPPRARSRQRPAANASAPPCRRSSARPTWRPVTAAKSSRC